MDHTYWHKQTNDKPLFPDMLWDRPENKRLAGKLLIIGGNSHEFAAPGQAYSFSLKAGAGVSKVLLPDALQKSIGKVLENGEFAPSTKSGSFGKKSLAEWLSWASWADGVLIAGDLGRNSETAIVLESFLEKYNGPVVLTKDAIDYFRSQAKDLCNREQTTLVLSLSQLQKLCIDLVFKTAVTFSMTINNLIELIHNLTKTYPINIVTVHNNIFFVAVNGQVSTTKNETEGEIWRLETASKIAVWQIQNPTKPFEATTTSLVT